MHTAVRRCLVIAVLALLVSGCAVRFVYNQLDWLIPWYLEDYMELEGPQEDLFKARLKTYLRWHRREQLPLYADFLDKVSGQAKKGLTREDIADVQLHTQELAQALVDRLEPDMIDLFAMATDKQVKQLFRKFEEDNKEFKEKYVDASPKKQRKRQASEARQYVERWTGSLSKQQRDMIDAWAQSYELMGKELSDTRLAWQKEFHRILKLREDRPAFETAFHNLMANPEFGRTDAMQQKFDRNQQQLIELYLDLDKSLTAEQRTRMVKKLHSYAEDFRYLAKH